MQKKLQTAPSHHSNTQPFQFEEANLVQNFIRDVGMINI